MAHEKIIMELMEALRIADKHIVGKIMARRGHWKAGSSATNNSYKVLSELVELKQLEKRAGYFRLPGCKSEYQEHARLLTEVLAELLIRYPESVIHREHLIREVGLRPDAICLLRNRGRGACLILEVKNTESEQYLESKLNVWRHWEGAPRYLAELFGRPIPWFDIAVADPARKKGSFAPSERYGHFEEYLQTITEAAA